MKSIRIPMKESDLPLCSTLSTSSANKPALSCRPTVRATAFAALDGRRNRRRVAASIWNVSRISTKRCKAYRREVVLCPHTKQQPLPS